MAIRAAVDEAAGRVTLTHPRREPITVDPDDPADAARLVAWVTPLADPGRARPGLRGARAGVGMTDSDFPSISILNRASLAALGERLGRPLAMERFRGNVWLDGLAPFARVRPRRPRDPGRRARRCACASGSPAARRRPSIPRPASATPTPSAALQAGWGHQDFGVYAEVIDGRPRRGRRPGGGGVKPVFADGAGARRRGARARAAALRRTLRLPEGRRRDGRPAAGRPAGGLLRRALQRRQVEPDQRADRAQGAGPRLEHAGPHPGDQLLRARRRRTTWSTCPATASPRRRSRWSSAGRRCCAPTSPGGRRCGGPSC